MKLCYFQHVPFEGLGAIEPWARSREHEVRAVRLFAGEPPPEPDACDMLVVLGGPMNADEEDRYPFLAAEKRAIERAIGAGRAVFGICLGSQLVARVLGAPVGRNEHEEIGWFPVDLTDEGARSPLLAGVPRRFETFHWHGDRFDVPASAVLAARSEACAHQAFVYGDRVVGLQFHPEATERSIALMLEHEGDELAGPAARPFVQTPAEIGSAARPYAENARAIAAILDNLERSVR
jgi:GMP synthase-like glutamine amidotransferase